MRASTPFAGAFAVVLCFASAGVASPSRAEGAGSSVGAGADSTTAASPLDALLPGTRIRIDKPDSTVNPYRLSGPGGLPERGGFRRMTGTLLSRSADALTLRRDGRHDSTVVPLGSLRWVEISVGQQPRTFQGAAVGVLLGAAVGVTAAIIAGSASHDGPGLDPYTGIAAVYLGGAGGLVGGIVGSITGSREREDRWERIPLSAPRSP